MLRTGQKLNIRARFASRQHTLLALAILLALLGLSGCGGSGSAAGTLITQKRQIEQLTIALEAPEKPPLLVEQDLVVSRLEVHDRVDVRCRPDVSVEDKLVSASRA